MRALSIQEVINSNSDLKIEHNKYNINVIASKGDSISPEEVLKWFSDFRPHNNEAHLYFHLPLCNYICKFCNYVKQRLSGNTSNEKEVQLWVDAWKWEAEHYLKKFKWISKAKIDSLYFGGGTAALMSPNQVEEMLRFASNNYNLTSDLEISLEGNPDNFSEKSILEFQQAGINRFSVGVQSLDDRVLKYSGRGHTSEMAVNSIRQLAKTELPFNVDYMFGLPFQTASSVEVDIQRIIDLGAPTITIYRLRNSDRQEMGIGNRSAWNNVALQRKMEKESLFPTVEEVYAIRERIENTFKLNSYSPSPCGWWSRSGVYSNGNIPKVSKSKWENYNTMLAYGPGAYGWISDLSPFSIQTHNVTDIHKYKEMIESKILPLDHGKKIDGFKNLATRLGFALKANQPISLDKYRRIYGFDLMTHEATKNVLQGLLSKKLIEFISPDIFRFSQEGETLHEEIISKMIHEHIGGFSGELCKRVSNGNSN